MMYHKNYTAYLHKELDFLKLLVSRFHEQEQLNDLELGVALQRTQEIYEHFLRMKLMPAVEANEKPPMPVLPTITPEPLPVETPEPLPVITPEPEKVLIAAEKPSTEKTEPVRNNPKQKTEIAKTTILAEKLSPSDFLPINETLAQQNAGVDLSSKLQTAPLSSIASGIGLNDKFLYTRELFKGDKNLYDSAIKHLDTADSLEEAIDFIKRHFDWDEKNETTQKFVNLLRRRHVEN